MGLSGLQLEFTEVAMADFSVSGRSSGFCGWRKLVASCRLNRWVWTTALPGRYPKRDCQKTAQTAP